MFGKPSWFREKTIRFALIPSTWQGWLYSGTWLSAITIPAVGLLGQGLLPETLIWLAASVGTLLFDMRKLRREQRWAKADVLVIE